MCKTKGKDKESFFSLHNMSAAMLTKLDKEKFEKVEPISFGWKHRTKVSGGNGKANSISFQSISCSYMMWLLSQPNVCLREQQLYYMMRNACNATK